MIGGSGLLDCPPWAAPVPRPRQPLAYLWDDARVEEDFAGDANRPQDFPDDQLDAIEFLYLYLLAGHVAIDRAEFARWAEAVSRRLATCHPHIEADPFDDLFERRVGEGLGPLIGRDVLDLTIPNERATAHAPAFLQAVLSGALAHAQADENLFVATPEDLADLNFESTPYRLPAVL